MTVLVVFILLLFIVLLCGRPERFRMATRDNEDSEQSQPHGQPSGSSRQMRRQSPMGVLLGVILVLSQAGSTAAFYYACTSNAHCDYSGCPKGYCVSTTYQSEPPCTPQFPYQVDMEFCGEWPIVKVCDCIDA